MFHVSRFKFQDKKGQMVIEAMIAASVLTFGLLGALDLLNRSLKLGPVISNNYIATYLAGEGVEIVKNIIDTNRLQSLPWDTGFPAGGDFEADYASAILTPYLGRSLFFDSGTNLYSYSGSGRQTSFIRLIRITIASAVETRVNSVVTWSTGRAQSSINVEDHFFDWRP